MSVIKFLDRIHLPLATWRAVSLLQARHLVRASSKQLARASFVTRRAFYAMCDGAAGLRDRVPDRREMSGSTVLAYLAVCVMSAMLVYDLLAPSPANSSVTPTPDRRPEWVEIARPFASFALESPALNGLEAGYHVYHHRAGGGRRDELTFGDVSGSGASMRVSLYRPGSEGMAEPDPFEAVVALAAASGIDAEVQETGRKLKTKFGALPIVAMSVSGGEEARACIAVAGGWNDPRLGLVAWWCNPGPEIVAQGQFACLLDRIALMSSGNDDQLAEFFARAELKRSFCNLQSSFVSPTPQLRNDWIHAKREPQLRGRLSAR